MNYRNITDAIDFYMERGYVYVPDAPWHVDKEAYYATKPEGCQIDAQIFPGSIPAQFMVASGEQSFLQMMLDGHELKRHVCVTPCFRAERHNDWHKPYFMKVELINAHDTDVGHLIQMVHDAACFFERYFSIRVTAVGDGYDIIEKGTRAELGSYGIRERYISGKRYRWIYGTGCAEPRLSTAIMRHNSTVGR